MPGWERGSLAVHGDDGHRYVSNTDGGVEFTAPFRDGETIGLGITYSLPGKSATASMPQGDGTFLNGEVFFTRNGRRDGGWNIHEEFDNSNEFGVLGIDGKHDLFGAIGTFGQVAFNVFFNRRDWLYQPT